MEEWTCERCGDAFFGIPHDSGLCIACQDETAEFPVRRHEAESKPS
jgi:hypothetical protein